MAEPQQNEKRKRKPRRLRQRPYRLVWHFLTVTILGTIGQALFILVFIIAWLLCSPCFLVAAAIERCRRYCPVHKTRFESESFTITTEEAEESQKHMIGRRGVRTTQSAYFTRLEETAFPYTNDGKPVFFRAGVHSRRYCLICHAIKQGYIERGEFPLPERRFSESECQEMEAKALSDLDAIEGRLGLTPDAPEQGLDETTGNQEVMPEDS